MFRFSEIYHIAFELATRRPLAFIPAVLVALLTYLLVELAASASVGFASEGIDLFPVLMRQFTELPRLNLGLIIAIVGALGTAVFLATTLLRHFLMSSAVAQHTQPHIFRSLLVSCIIASFFFVPATVLMIMTTAILTLVPTLTEFLIALARSPIFIMVIILFISALLFLALIFRFSLLYAVTFPLSPLSALKLGTALLRAHFLTTLVAIGIITLSAAAFTGLSNLAILYTSRASSGPEDSIAVSFVVAATGIFMGLATLLSEALWAAFFYLIARVPGESHLIQLADEVAGKLESPGTLPPQG